MQISDPARLADLQQTLPNLYERYARAFCHLNQPMEALLTLERGRGQGLARQSRLNDTDLSSLFQPGEVGELKQRSDEVTKYKSLLRATQEKLDSSTEPDQSELLVTAMAEYKPKESDAEQRYQLLRDALFTRYPRFKELRVVEPPTSAQMLALGRRNPDTLFIQWGIADNSSVLIALDKSGVKAFLLPIGDNSLSLQVDSWRAALLTSRGQELRMREEARLGNLLLKVLFGPLVNSDILDPNDIRDIVQIGRGPVLDVPRQGRDSGIRDEAHLGNLLFKALFGPLVNSGMLNPKSIRHIVLVGGGPILDVPMSALMDNSGKRLIESYDVSNAVSFSILNKTDNFRDPKESFLCVADPLGDKPTAQEIQFAYRRAGAGPLPSARKEGAELTRLFDKPLLLLGSDAKEATIRNVIGNYALLHFATHGYLESNDPLRSGLILAKEPDGSPYDGLLTGKTIVTMTLAAQLAVLSACETGRGQLKAGEGLQGLAWAFRAAGCPAVVASHWMVDDEITSPVDGSVL